MKIVADEFLGKLLGFDHCFNHSVSCRLYCFGRTFCPSFKSAGGLRIKSSPPINPFEIVAPCDDVPDTCTGRRTALPSTMMKTAPSRTAAAGTVMSGFAADV